MKIIRCSNFDKETFSESVMAEGIPNRDAAEAMCDALIAKYCPTGHEEGYFRVVPDDYALHTWEP